MRALHQKLGASRPDGMLTPMNNIIGLRGYRETSINYKPQIVEVDIVDRKFNCSDLIRKDPECNRCPQAALI